MESLKAINFNFLEELFRSQTGTVWKAKYRNRGPAGGNPKGTKETALLSKFSSPFVVLKERRAAELGRAKSITRELELLQQLNHPNIIQCLGHFYDTARGGAAQNIDGVLYMVLEYAQGGDLYKDILRRKAQHEPYTESEIFHIFRQLCRGVQHLHEKGIVHRDIKALNVLLAKTKTTTPHTPASASSVDSGSGPHQWCYKLGDLGVGRELGTETVMLQTFYGTPLYSSPELCANQPYNELTDIWSLGVVLYELAALTHPFTAQNLMGLASAISTEEYPPIPALYSEFLNDIIAAMLQKDWQHRPRINEILGWLEDEQLPAHVAGRGSRGGRSRGGGGERSKSVAGHRGSERPPSSYSVSRGERGERGERRERRERREGRQDDAVVSGRRRQEEQAREEARFQQQQQQQQQRER